MPHGRQLRLFLVDGTSSGPRFYEIVNRTIQALGIPVIRIGDLVSETWPEFQKPGVYLVRGSTEEGAERLYVGKGENVAKRVQGHPDRLEFEVTSLLLFTSKDENLHASQVGWLESKLISAVEQAKRVPLANVQRPPLPLLPKAELATVCEFFDDLVLMAQTAGFDFFTQPKVSAPAVVASGNTEIAPKSLASLENFHFQQARKDIHAHGYPSDEGFVVRAGSDVSPIAYDSFKGGYAALRQKLIDQGVIAPKPDGSGKLYFTLDYAFSAPSAAASVIAGGNTSGTANWKTSNNITLGEYLKAPTAATQPTPSTPT